MTSPLSNLRIMYFDNKCINHEQKNICNILLSVYVITVWKIRKENLRIAKSMIMKKCLDIIETTKHKPNQTIDNVLGDNPIHVLLL